MLKKVLGGAGQCFIAANFRLLPFVRAACLVSLTTRQFIDTARLCRDATCILETITNGMA